MNSSKKTSWVPRSISEGLAPLWYRNQVWQDKLAKKAAHRATDIPEDDVQINTNKTGMGALGVMGVAAASSLAPLAIYFAMAGRGDARPISPTAPVQATQPAAAVQLDSEWYHVLYTPPTTDAAGKIITPEKVVERIRYRSRSGVVERQEKDGSWTPAPTVRPPS